MRSFCTSWSHSSCAPASSSVPSRRSRSMKMSRKRRDAADRHRRAVRFLDGAEIGEIRPLHGLLGIRRRPCDVAIVELRHRREILQRADLLGQLLARADHLVGRPHVVDLRALGVLGFEQRDRRRRARRADSRR